MENELVESFALLQGGGSTSGSHAGGANLVYSTAPLLSGRKLTDCQTVDDETCTGGVAAVDAYARYYSTSTNTNYPTMIVPGFDYSSAFVQMHPLGWNVNRLVMHHLLNWKVFVERPWIFDVEGAQQRSLQELQTEHWPLLLSNVNVPPSNSWYSYTKGVYFDSTTNLAILVIIDNVIPFDSPQIESAQTMLNYVARINERIAGCAATTTGEAEDETLMTSSGNPSLADYLDGTVPTTSSGMATTSVTTGGKCWIPVIVYRQQSSADANDLFQSFIEAITVHNNPPALIMDVEGRGNPEIFGTPKLMGTNNKPVWVTSFRASSRSYHQAQITFTDDQKWITNVTMMKDALADLPLEAKDDVYESHIQTLRQYADETIQNDPVIGNSTYMPVNKANGFVFCEAGECPAGNLFTDAMKWYTGVDFAVSNSGAYHGLGWNAGSVRVSHIWDTFPFANTLCQGTMTGLSMYKLFNFSTWTASFTATDSPDDGLLQISNGLRVTYNTQWNYNDYDNKDKDLVSSRLVKIELWNETSQEYHPIDRLSLYTFVTDSYNCRVNFPFNVLTGSNLTLPGEQPSQVRPEIIQTVVADYLSQLRNPYNTTIQGRLINDTAVSTTPMNWIETERTCPIGTYWIPAYETCFTCPTTDGVYFQEESIEYDGLISGIVTSTDNNDGKEIVLINEEGFPVDVVLKSLPPFIEYNGNVQGFGQQQQSMTVDAGTTAALSFTANAEQLEAGTAHGEVVLGISDGGGIYPGCVGNDVKFVVSVRVNPTSELNQLGWLTYFSWFIGIFMMISATSVAIWCYRHRENRILKALQPAFLLAVCMGVFVLGAAAIPMSIDDGVTSIRGCDIACMATPWFLSMGFLISFSALFSKLWRINQLVQNMLQFRRVQILEHEVLGPFAILFTFNFVVMLAWTLIDPLHWERIPYKEEPWNTYGTCRGNNDKATVAFFITIGALNFGCLALACYQAYLSRKLAAQYTEAKSIGFAIFSWFQLSLVGIPVMSLLDEGNGVKPTHALRLGLLFAISMSLLLSIFVPIGKKYYKAQRRGGDETSQIPRSSIKISGVGDLSGHLKPASGHNVHKAKRRKSNGNLSFDGSVDTASGPSGRRRHSVSWGDVDSLGDSDHDNGREESMDVRDISTKSKGAAPPPESAAGNSYNTTGTGALSMNSWACLDTHDKDTNKPSTPLSDATKKTSKISDYGLPSMTSWACLDHHDSGKKPMTTYEGIDEEGVDDDDQLVDVSSSKKTATTPIKVSEYELPSMTSWACLDHLEEGEGSKPMTTYEVIDEEEVDEDEFKGSGSTDDDDVHNNNNAVGERIVDGVPNTMTSEMSSAPVWSTIDMAGRSVSSGDSLVNEA